MLYGNIVFNNLATSTLLCCQLHKDFKLEETEEKEKFKSRTKYGMKDIPSE